MNTDFDFDDGFGAERGCGNIKEGGTYFSVGLSKNGIPIEVFYVDPVIRVPDDFGLKTMGFTLKERTLPDGTVVMDVFDHIGDSGYKHPTDWIEEVAHLGFHQKIDPSILKVLDPKHSRYYATHSKAWYPESLVFEPVLCMCSEEHDHGYPEFCVHRLWECIPEEAQDESRKVVRSMPSFEYEGYSAPEGFDRKELKEGIFFVMPVSMMQVKVYEDTSAEEKDKKALEIIEETKLKDVTTHVIFTEEE